MRSVRMGSTGSSSTRISRRVIAERPSLLSWVRTRSIKASCTARHSGFLMSMVLMMSLMSPLFDVLTICTTGPRSAVRSGLGPAPCGPCPPYGIAHEGHAQHRQVQHGERVPLLDAPLHVSEIDHVEGGAESSTAHGRVHPPP